MIVADSRKIRIYRVVVVNGELHRDNGADLWQDADGTVRCSGLWAESINPSPYDLIAQAKAMAVSPLEWIVKRLSVNPYLQIEVK